ncbi:MAG: 50S ribosomal protein L15 [Mycoplasmataceae bacterium]|nr:MAG: 50S ribosomal protein L15 [Mycoplasmataceae bacterium]
MTINNYLVNIVKKSKRVGRGDKTAGRGGKGQTARTGGVSRTKKWKGFEGGQTPVFRRFPKRGGGFIKDKKISYQIINLNNLQNDKGIVNDQIVDFSQEKLPRKILGGGELTKKLTIKAASFSKQAQEKITKAGGHFEIVK